MRTTDPPAGRSPWAVVVLVNTLLTGIGGIYVTTGSEPVTLAAGAMVAVISLMVVSRGRESSSATSEAIRRDRAMQADYEEFFTSWFPRLVAILISSGYERVTAEDAAMETMTEALDNWSGIHTPQSWTVTTAFRKASRMLRPDGHGVGADQVQTGWSDGIDTFVTIEKAIAVLPEKQRIAMLLTLAGLKPREIAEHMRCSSEQVRRNLADARKKMRTQLNLGLEKDR